MRELIQQFPASVPLALVLKKFLADRSLDHSYSGGLSSYCLVSINASAGTSHNCQMENIAEVKYLICTCRSIFFKIPSFLIVGKQHNVAHMS